MINKYIQTFCLFSIYGFLSTNSFAISSQNIPTFPQNQSMILSTKLASKALDQCSRGTPKTSVFWTPTLKQIQVLESELPLFLNQRKLKKLNIPNPKSYGRQYIGIILKSKKYIYGNFYPADFFRQPAEAVNVCDGFGSFWGILYSPDEHQFSQLDINGLIVDSQ